MEQSDYVRQPIEQYTDTLLSNYDDMSSDMSVDMYRAIEESLQTSKYERQIQAILRQNEIRDQNRQHEIEINKQKQEQRKQEAFKVPLQRLRNLKFYNQLNTVELLLLQILEYNMNSNGNEIPEIKSYDQFLEVEELITKQYNSVFKHISLYDFYVIV